MLISGRGKVFENGFVVDTFDEIMRHHSLLGRMFGVPLLEIAGWGDPPRAVARAADCHILYPHPNPIFRSIP